jgi:hypothetical protein
MVAIATKTEAYSSSRILIFVIKAWIGGLPKNLDERVVCPYFGSLYAIKGL